MSGDFVFDFAGAIGWVKVRTPSPCRVLAWPPLESVRVTGFAPSGGHVSECCHLLMPMVKYWTLGVFWRKPLSSPLRK